MSADVRSRVNRQSASQRLQTFAHADQAEPAAPCGIDVEPHSIVRYRQLDLMVGRVQVHPHFMRSAVLDGVLHGFLGNSEQA